MQLVSVCVGKGLVCCWQGGSVEGTVKEELAGETKINIKQGVLFTNIYLAARRHCGISGVLLRHLQLRVPVNSAWCHTVPRPRHHHQHTSDMTQAASSAPRRRRGERSRWGISVVVDTWVSTTAMAHDEPQGNRPPTRQIRGEKATWWPLSEGSHGGHTPWQHAHSGHAGALSNTDSRKHTD